MSPEDEPQQADMTDSCVRWEPINGIDAPCASIAFYYQHPDDISVTMRFSQVRGGLERDLLILFTGATSMRWESEHVGLIPLPDLLPRCLDPWSRWTFPLLRIDDSGWLSAHAAHYPIASEGRVHFAIVTMNDIFHILAFPDVSATWIDPSSAGLSP